MKKKIVFLTGTRADYGKIKSIISLASQEAEFQVNIFATGMHLSKQYGLTINEIYKDQFKNIYPFINQNSHDGMDSVLAKTILGFSDYVKEHQPQLIFIHGDRVEALAAAIVGAMNNILVAHIEGGEVSGTIDESIRHSISKLSHFHFTANQEAKERLIRMGEAKQEIQVVGSPDIDIMLTSTLPTLNESLQKYDLNFKDYAIAIFHPITTDLEPLEKDITAFLNALEESEENYIGIYPNNDHGSSTIINSIELLSNKKVRFFPSIRFENFLTLLKNSKFIIGNSSAGIREAPVYEIPTINIGNRQKNRSTASSIYNCSSDKATILSSIRKVITLTKEESTHNTKDISFGSGQSAEKIISTIKQSSFWKTPMQKHFNND